MFSPNNEKLKCSQGNILIKCLFIKYTYKETNEMIKEINIKCPTCETILTTVNIGEDVKGTFIHKCIRCKRYWKMNYTKDDVFWIRGKDNTTFIKRYKLDKKSGNSTPY